MARLRRLAIALLVASTVTVGSLSAVPAASAMPMSCEVRYEVALAYYATAQLFYGLGNYATAMYWVGKSYGIVQGC